MAVSREAWLVITMTSVSPDASLILRSSSIPLMPGKTMSTMARATGASARRVSPSSALPAATTS